ncbi:MAG: excinuclease ABC subunit UvrB [Armatimonadetes bacterium]|nr:excinuclease ABC subunit UvrB [Armatimonadota bacterium]
MDRFRLNPDYSPKGDQQQAIDLLAEGLTKGHRFQTLKGATGTGKTFTMAAIAAALQRPALVIAHNKTLAAQLCQEFRAFFPDNSVQYFISYYDYYQPEAYVPQTDTYIEKDSSINDEIDRLRHAATQAVLERRDALVVASVSCIFGLGSPDEYMQGVLTFEVGAAMDMRDCMRKLVGMTYKRNDMVLGRGTFRARGDVLEVQPADEEIITRVEFFGDEIERIRLYDPLTGETLDQPNRITIFPATHYVTPWDRLQEILIKIDEEAQRQQEYFLSQGKHIEAQRIRQRTDMDLEMMRELGYCSGIENYSRYLDGRSEGEPPYTLMDYFPKDVIIFVDESHQTIPQLRAMYNGDRQRKSTLVEYGFRLPSALDNRPLRFEEFLDRVGQVIFVSATPGPFERDNSAVIAEQVIRPTGLLDPNVEVRPTKGQIDDLIAEIQQTVDRGDRALVTTLTKKMAEDLTDYLREAGMKVQYLHSTVHTLERMEILRDLRLGNCDIVVGVNLLREGLDLPEVSLVAILDADKEGFLRSETSLIQTIGRAARNKLGRVVLYADKITGSMERAIDETNRRRAIQEAHNLKHGIEPETIKKEVRDSVRSLKVAEESAAYDKGIDPDRIAFEDLPMVIARLEREMKEASKALEFEEAAAIRDEIFKLRAILEQTKRL